MPIPQVGKLSGNAARLAERIKSIHDIVQQEIEVSNAKYKELLASEGVVLCLKLEILCGYF